MTGLIEILSVGKGDIKVQIETDEDLAKAMEMLTAMEAQGYAILVDTGNRTYQRVQRVDVTTGSYILTMTPEEEQAEDEQTVAAGGTPKKKKGGRPRTKQVPVKEAKAVGVARSAGG